MSAAESVVFGQALLVPLVAILALLIAYGQFRTARHGSKIELFERRFAVYLRTMAYIDASWQSNSVAQEKATAYWAAVAEARFLFGRDVIDVLEAIKSRGVEVTVARQMIRATPPEEELKYVYCMRDHQQWFAQAEESVTEVFRPYLQLH